MSKELTPTPQSLSCRFRLLAGGLLLYFPFAPAPDLASSGAWFLYAMVAALGAFLLTDLMARLPPFAETALNPLWIPLLLAPALPHIFPVYRPETAAGLHLIPFLLLLRILGISRGMVFLSAAGGSILLTAWLGAGGGPALDRLTPGIFTLLLPLLFCLRKPWRGFAVPFASFSLAAFFMILNLSPLPFWRSTAGMTDAEARERAPGTPPAPRYRIMSDAQDPLPSPFSRELVTFIQERQTALSRASLHGLFDSAPLPPEEMVRALRVYGFIQRDRNGYHVPAEAFTRNPADHVAPDYIVWVERLREHAGIDPESLDPELLREARRHEILLPIRFGEPQLRFSANHRGRFENELRPRHVLTLLDQSPESPPLTAEAHAQRWGLTLNEAEADLRELYERQWLEPVRRAAEPLRPPAVVLPDANRGLRLLLRWGLFAAGMLLLRPAEPEIRKWLYGLGALSLWGFTAGELASAAASLPAAARLAMWLAPVSLGLTAAAVWFFTCRRGFRTPGAAAREQ